MSLNQQFLDRPDRFASMYTLYPYADDVTNASQMKSLAIDGSPHLTQVQGVNKVAYCDILPATKFNAVPADEGGSYHGEGDLYVMRITYNKRGASSIPVYYLPWRADHVMRIKLKPSRKHPTKEGSFWPTAVEPDVFVAARSRAARSSSTASPINLSCIMPTRPAPRARMESRSIRIMTPLSRRPRRRKSPG